ncbi:unnamed protein product [Paramecium sonneborni]|uniref:Uncharacterized protein n=1 Tax=Paramecium sonneborni TaxID=65129 RepID=A0A8S1N206_9CILI|nr:unnamed protein product [Paramecium sonneborni]
MVDKIQMKQLWMNLQKFILDPVIYRPLLFIFFFMATPSPATSMFYFYINQLKLNDEFFITLRYTYSFCTIMAVTIYYLFRRYPFGQFLSVSNMLYFFASFLSLLLVTRINIEYNIPDYQFCMWDNILMQTLQEINTLPVLVLGAKMCPKYLEGTVYSLLTGTMNLGNTISKQIGIILTFYLGITNQNFTYLWLLILICTVGSLLPMPFIGAVNEEEVDQKKKSLAKEDIHIKVE